MTAITLDLIRNCLEGFVPSAMATCDADGVPNVSLISHVHYVDPDRVALSYQFFNKTRRNVLATGHASVSIIDPLTAEQFRLTLDFEETQTSGPVFEIMKAKLAGIASHSGMNGVFRLLGSDIYRVRRIERLPGMTIAAPPARRNLLAGTRRVCAELGSTGDVGELLERALLCLEREFGIEHAMIWMLDRPAGRLFAVASHGYPVSGIGSELALGEGVIGVAAREGVPIRIGHMTSEFDYSAAIRGRAEASGSSWADATRIPYPGLRQPQSQIALPIRKRSQVIGVLFAECEQPMRFWFDDEDALALIASQLGTVIALMQHDEATTPGAAPEAKIAPARLVAVRHYQAMTASFSITST